ncbi:MAG TPA: nitronate monooxygenase [Geminicoccus sp.]|uniref:NAD(P)H-dependent flavin oxidoreductase n=1 Tax=Geminicoccus sp. TaxID=2024832 RepID=UPI002C3B6F05|nr:nitronate monooxygenase [Geminicoccus sp.]HWL69790.1 nitronate monooxygenase [Geminicoccus sp.]
MLPAHPLLAAASARGRRFLGCELAFLGGAMTWVSERNLVTALGRAGAFGVLACGAMTPERLDEEIQATQALSDAPFGVNLIVMHPDLARLVQVCLDRKVSHIVLAGGLPHKDTIQAIRQGGAKLVCFAPTLALAKKLVRSGADALVIEGSEAGGHVGPVSTSVLAQEILPFVTDVPVFVAGGIGHGEMIAAYLRMGAAGVQMGTRFAAATESIAHPAFKQAFVRASARDAVTSVQIDPQFKVIPVRGLVNTGTERFAETQVEVIGRYRRGEASYEEASLQIERFWAGALRRAVVEGDVEQGSLMAGQSVGFVKAVEPVTDILAELVVQTEAALARRAPAGALPAAAE